MYSFIQTLTLVQQGFKRDLGNIVGTSLQLRGGRRRLSKEEESLLPGWSGVSEGVVLELGVEETAGPLGDPAGGPVSGVGGMKPSIPNRCYELVLFLEELLVQ